MATMDSLAVQRERDTLRPATPFLQKLKRETFWNWKAAALSVALRAPIFLFTSWRHGWWVTLVAVLVEVAYRVVISGFCGAITQWLSHTKPLWRSVFYVTILLPAIEFELDYLIHQATGTPNLRTGMTASLAVTALSSLFNLYSMSKGTFIVGTEAKPLASDVRAIPRLVRGFIREPVVWLTERVSALLRTFGDRGNGV